MHETKTLEQLAKEVDDLMNSPEYRKKIHLDNVKHHAQNLENNVRVLDHFTNWKNKIQNSPDPEFDRRVREITNLVLRQTELQVELSKYCQLKLEGKS